MKPPMWCGFSPSLVVHGSVGVAYSQNYHGGSTPRWKECEGVRDLLVWVCMGVVEEVSEGITEVGVSGFKIKVVGVDEVMVARGIMGLIYLR